MTSSPMAVPYFSSESIKVMAESVGIPQLPDDVAKDLADDITFKLKTIIQDAGKFMHHGKRKRLTTADFDSTLQIKNIEPMYGVFAKEHIPFRFATGGGRELHFIEDKELEIQDMVSAPAPRFPLQMTIKPHWLAIEGIQPSIPENPPPVSKDLQKKEAVDPAAKISTQVDARDSRHIHGRGMKSTECIKVKQLATHELSAEQQLYYKEITEACVGADEPKRGEALHSLAFDPGLHQMVPRLCTFIAEGVRVNVVQKNLALLIYLMRMAKSLLDNQSIYLEKYLHEIVPSVMSCIVSRQLCQKPDLDNHWALRDFAARLISQICKNYNTTTNGLQTRITRVLGRCMNTERTPLVSMYGSIAGLSELGPEVCKVFILPKLRQLSDKIEQCMEGNNTYEKNSMSHIRAVLLKALAPVLKMLRSPPDIADEYRAEYGYLGMQLHGMVLKARQVPSAIAPIVANNPGQIRAGTQQTRMLQQGPSNINIGTQRTLVVNKAGVPSQITNIQAQAPSQGHQKVIIMASRNQPNTVQIASPDTVNVVKQLANPQQTSTFNLTSQPTQTFNLQHQQTSTFNILSSNQTPGPGQKFVLVSGGPNQPPIKQEIKEEPADHPPTTPQHSMDVMQL